MEPKDFVKEFKRLIGLNEFDPHLYDLEGIEGIVILSNAGYCASGKGNFIVEKPSFSIRIRMNPHSDRESIFEFISKNLVGTYYIRKDNESESTSYGFRIKNSSEDSLEFEINLYDS